MQELRYPRQTDRQQNTAGFLPAAALAMRELPSHQQGRTGSTETGDETDKGRLTENLDANLRGKTEELCVSAFYEDVLESFCKSYYRLSKGAGHFSNVV